MFAVSEAEATAIRDAFHQRGEFAAAVELRRLFPGIRDTGQARECVRDRRLEAAAGAATASPPSAAGAMTRSELVTELAADAPYLGQAGAEAIVSMVFDHIAVALARGQRVELRGFGAFTVKRRGARMSRNPRTGEDIPVDEKAVPWFRASPALRARVNRRAPR